MTGRSGERAAAGPMNLARSRGFMGWDGSGASLAPDIPPIRPRHFDLGQGGVHRGRLLNKPGGWADGAAHRIDEDFDGPPPVNFWFLVPAASPALAALIAHTWNRREEAEVSFEW